MKKNLIFFIGGVAVLGAGAYFFLRKKKTPTDSGASTSVSTTNTQLSGVSSVEQIVDLAKNIEEARNLASSIKLKKDEIAKLQSRSSQQINLPKFGFSSVNSLSTKNMIYKKQIDDLQKAIDVELSELNKLGFTELNGNPIKIA